MAREATTGRGGVYSHFGPRSTNEKVGGVQNVGGRFKDIVYKITYDDLPGGSTDDAVAYVPIGARIIDCWFDVTTAFAGGTSYTVGLEQSDGTTAIDADGLFAGLILADIDATQVDPLVASLYGASTPSAAGALIGSTPLTVNGYLVMAATGTFTAGAANVILRYLP